MGAMRYSACWATTLSSLLSMTAIIPSVLGSSEYAVNGSPSRKDTKCIASKEDLLQAFIKQQDDWAVPANQTIYKISQEYMLTYTQFIIHYRTTPPHPEGNVSAAINNYTCCNPVTEEDCYVLVTSRKLMFVYLPPPLVYTMTPIVHQTTQYLQSRGYYGVLKGCWTPPMFCDDTNRTRLLRDFSLKLLSYHLKDLVEDVPIPTIIVAPRTWFSLAFHVPPSLWIHLLFVTMCLFSLPG